jgi:hypothetical protein
MKFSKYAKSHLLDWVFVGLVTLAFIIYFIVYITPSRTAWYNEMTKQVTIFFDELFTIGR